MVPFVEQCRLDEVEAGHAFFWKNTKFTRLLNVEYEGKYQEFIPVLEYDTSNFQFLVCDTPVSIEKPISEVPLDELDFFVDKMDAGIQKVICKELIRRVYSERRKNEAMNMTGKIF